MQHSGKYSDPKAQYKNRRTGDLFYAQEWAGEIVAEPVKRSANAGSRRYSIEAFEARFIRVTP